MDKRKCKYCKAGTWHKDELYKCLKNAWTDLVEQAQAELKKSSSGPRTIRKVDMNKNGVQFSLIVDLFHLSVLFIFVSFLSCVSLFCS